MKKGDIIEGIITDYSFPNKGSFLYSAPSASGDGTVEERKIIVKNALPGSRVRVRIIKKKSGYAEGTVVDVLEKSPLETKRPICNHFYSCGGCTYQTVSYTNQLKLKEDMVKKVLKNVMNFGVAEADGNSTYDAEEISKNSSAADAEEISKNSSADDAEEISKNSSAADAEEISKNSSADDAEEISKNSSAADADEISKNCSIDDSEEISKMSSLPSINWEGIIGSPDQFRYRNKMEFTFGDEEKDGPLTLGLHRQFSNHDILSIDSCGIVSPTWNEILKYTQKFYRKLGVPYYNKYTHKGVLRNLVIRQSVSDGRILVNLVTTTHHSIDESTRNIPWHEKRSETVDELQLPQYVAGLLSIGEPKPIGLDAYTSHGYQKANTKKKIVRDKWGKLQRVNGSFEDNVGSGEFDSLSYYNKIAGVIYTECDTLADAIIPDSVTLLYGEEFLMEEILGLKFKISPFSFFQTNTKGAELLYSKVREYALAALGGENEKTGVIYDLYSGTGTIAQLMSPVAEKVYGIEIIEEAVEAAKENAKLNKLTNCEFIAGDVLKKLDELEEKPDLIILDPPRDGLNPKALTKILAYGVKNIVYVSCKPTSLARDLEIFEANGYMPVRGCCCDMFPNTVHVETIVLIERTRNA